MALKIEAEIKVSSEPCVVAWDNKLFVGTEDGSISSVLLTCIGFLRPSRVAQDWSEGEPWGRPMSRSGRISAEMMNDDEGTLLCTQSYDYNLSVDTAWPAHGVQLFALAAGGGAVYSASNDGGIRVWSPKGEKIAELPPSAGDVGVLHVFGKHLYAGDEAGLVTIYENNIEKARYCVLEEVKDLGLSLPYLFTARDLDVTVTEIKPEESKNRFVTRHTMEGRAPLRVLGARFLCMARGGNSLLLHDSSVATTFKKLHEVKVSDMIVTSLSASGDFAWTGGWDGCVRRWEIADDQLKAAGSMELGTCVNGLVATSPDNAYAVSAGGRVVRIKAA